MNTARVPDRKVIQDLSIVIVIISFLFAEYVTYMMATGINLLLSQVFYIPVLYVSFRFPQRSILAILTLGLSYLGILFFFTHPAIPELLSAITQFNVYIIVGVIVAGASNRIRLNEMKFQEIFCHAGNPFGILDVGSENFIEMNPAFRALFDLRNKEAESSLRNIIPDSSKRDPVIKRIRSGDSIESLELRIIKSDNSRLDVLMNATPLDNAGLAILTFTDITRRKQIEEKITAAVRESEDVFRLLSQVAPVGIFFTDHEGNLFYVNDQWCEITGLKIQDAKGHRWKNSLHPEDRERVLCEWTQNHGQEFSRISEARFIHSDGSVVWVFGRIVARKDANGSISGYVGVIVDITELKKYENQLQASLNEKSVLLMEVHHRVKNNLQVISSLIRLQARYITDEKALKAFRQCERRVTTMALVHESLYRSENLAYINANRHFNKLATTLLMAEGMDKKITLETDVDNIDLDLDTAVPCSLIINELVTNAMKHAFSGRECGTIYLSFHRKDDDVIALEVTDNGTGIPGEFDPETAGSLGLKLVVRLARDQLGGKLSRSTSRGTTFIIEFPCDLGKHPLEG